MKVKSIADVVRGSDAFLRSVNVERDFDTGVVNDYILTPHARTNFARLVAGLRPDAKQRAWRITSDYGSGKSSFALAFAKLFSEEKPPASLKGVFDIKRELGQRAPKLLPVLVTGSRQPMATAVIKSLHRTLSTAKHGRRRPVLLERVRALAEGADAPGDEEVVRLLEEANAYVAEARIADGMLLVLDEMGKFLEFAAQHPERQDVLFLQNLAEAAARSGSTPLFLIGLLHQGFNAYAAQLSHGVQKEWEKVAGRFNEMLFALPSEQTTALIASAMNVDVAKLSRDVVKDSEREMARVVGLHAYGPSVSEKRLVELASRLYPLHPTVIPVLMRLFSRFGQNERSLFSFLFSEEPSGLQEFLRHPLAGGAFYRLYNLYDYARSSFGSRLSVQSYRSHWNQLESVVESYPREDADELNALKTVALLNLIDDSALLASEALITSCVGRDASRVVDRLRTKHVLHFRGVAGGYCLWPHTSVNLERAYQVDAANAVGVPRSVSGLLSDFLETRAVVARRHYLQTGNLRHFEVEYVAPSALDSASRNVDRNADGKIVIPLCETESERSLALEQARALKRIPANVLIAIPNPLSSLVGLVAEHARWKWISENTPELRDDAYAAEEVSRQLITARDFLDRAVRAHIGLREFNDTMQLKWFQKGKAIEIHNARALLQRVSSVCDEVFPTAPIVKNELVNRRELSSAAAAARMRLIERVLTSADQPLFGMDETKKPPEMSMYLSVLKKAGLHRQHGDTWILAEPPDGNDPCQVRPVFAALLRRLEAAQEERVLVPELFEEMQKAPYGVRDGLGWLLFATFVVLQEQNLAFYEDGGFVRHLGPEEFLRLTKKPSSFEVQFCRVAGIRSVVFEQLLQILDKQPTSPKPDILDVVRPLCEHAALLPQYTHRTKSLSPAATAVRETLLHAREPAKLLFEDLPTALSLGKFEDTARPDAKTVREFVRLLRAALDELTAAYPTLLGMLGVEFLAAVQQPGNLDDVRSQVAHAAKQVSVAVSEPRMKGFLLRLGDTALGPDAWLESIGSFICARPPSKWHDADLDGFRSELHALGTQYRRLEAMHFESLKQRNKKAIRVAVTASDGTEHDRVLWLAEEEEAQAAEIEEAVTMLLRGRTRVGAVAASRALARVLGDVAGRDESRSALR